MVVAGNDNLGAIWLDKCHGASHVLPNCFKRREENGLAFGVMVGMGLWGHAWSTQLDCDAREQIGGILPESAKFVVVVNPAGVGAALKTKGCVRRQERRGKSPSYIQEYLCGQHES